MFPLYPTPLRKFAFLNTKHFYMIHIFLWFNVLQQKHQLLLSDMLWHHSISALETQVLSELLLFDLLAVVHVPFHTGPCPLNTFIWSLDWNLSRTICILFDIKMCKNSWQPHVELNQMNARQILNHQSSTLAQLSSYASWSCFYEIFQCLKILVHENSC